MPKQDIHQKITDQIIAALEAGTAPWQREWKGAGQPLHMPLRHTGQLYRGINVLLLWIAAQERGFGNSRWLTYRQAQAIGAQVRKGERGTAVVYYGQVTKERDDGTEDEIRFLKSYTVFNVAQVDGLPADLDPASQIDTGARHVPAIRAAYDAVGAKVIHTGGQPCYVPGLDQIQMPAIQQFETAESYYGTLAHELAHWTGHKSRLDRFPDATRHQDYAFEELVAELAACFTCAQVGGLRDVNRSAAYIGSWLKALRNDKKYIFRAAAKAQAASDYLLAAMQDAGALDAAQDTRIAA